MSFKLKVGRGTVEEDVQNARALRGRIGPRASLRLDANRAWDERQGKRFAHAVEDLDVEYIEEPLKDPGGLRAFSQSTGMPVAADESLADDPAPDWREWSFLRAVVMKPTLLGGIASTLVRIAAARGAGIMPVMSSSFESAVGLRHLALLALTADLGSIAHGLDTGRWFEQDLLEEALATTGGCIQRDALLAPSIRVRHDLLEPLT
jgi:O-succinylbenzoate synthase